MGGEDAGELAAAAAAAALAEVLHEQPKPQQVCEALVRAIQNANEAVLQVGRQIGSSRVGATVAAVALLLNQVWLAHAGDSRVYAFHSGRLQQMTEDQTEANLKVRLGLLTVAAAQKDRSRHRLTMHLGLSPEEVTVMPVVSGPIPFHPGDLLLLCTDGLSEALDDDRLETLFGQYKTVSSLADELISQAIRLSGHDNTTLVIVEKNKAGTTHD